jgi:uncharacterized coiled-coil protein SlyX
MSEMKDMMSSFASLQSDMKDMKNELDHVKLQSSIAQSTAEEALEVATNVDDRVKALEENAVSQSDVQKMIDAAVLKLKSTLSESATKLTSLDDAFYKLKSTVAESTSKMCSLAAVQNKPGGDLDEKFCRTVVIGGFGQDTPKDEILEFLNANVLKDVAGIDEAYAYNYGSVGFVRFESKDGMYNFLKSAGQKPKAKINGKEIWISVSKTPEERLKAKSLGKLKRVLIETGLTEPANVRIDYKRGIVFANRKRVAEWTASENGEQLAISKVGLQVAGIKVDAEKLNDAVAELMQE